MTEAVIHTHKPQMPGTPVDLYHRVVLPNGALATQASFTSITMRAYNKATGAQIGADLGVVIATSVFDTIQTSADDARFPDSGPDAAAGFNFRHHVPASYLAKGPAIVRIEYDAVTSAGLGSETFTLGANNIPLLEKIG